MLSSTRRLAAVLLAVLAALTTLALPVIIVANYLVYYVWGDHPFSQWLLNGSGDSVVMAVATLAALLLALLGHTRSRVLSVLALALWVTSLVDSAYPAVVLPNVLWGLGRLEPLMLPVVGSTGLVVAARELGLMQPAIDW